MSGKNPAFQFYPLDYTRDTRVLTTEARGVWMDVLCVLWWTEPKIRSKKLPIADWSRLCSVKETEFSSAILQFERHNICDLERDGNGDVTITSRRMIRDDEIREHQRKRKAKFDAKKKKERAGNATVTDKSHCSSSSSSSSVTKVTLTSEGDLIHQILKERPELSGLTYEQDLVARRKNGYEIKDPVLEELAREAVSKAILMGELDYPGSWWSKQLELSRAGLSPEQGQKKEPPASALCKPKEPEAY
jgi:uncharacterized protein YdaU (DUF1376 family)